MTAAPTGGGVLVVYTLYDRRPRESLRDHLEAFRRYSGQRCFYLNLAVHRAPRLLRFMRFDMVVFHTSFLSKRASTEVWEQQVQRARPLKGLGRVRVALPQDEYLPPARLCDFIDEFRIDHVFSVAPASEWPAIYPTIDPQRVKLSRVLTGYLDPGAVGRIERLQAGAARPPVDIGYRAKDLPAWLGRHARAKAELAGAVAAAARRHGLSCDISTRSEDTLLGADWLRFLLACRYTIGAEGGASLLDHDGTLRPRVERFLAEHQDASFDEVEAACFPGQDGTFGLVALSPRHLEACATRTCQVLVEGEYSGVLEPDRHYIPLRADLSNLDDVLTTLARDDRREAIVEAAYADIVASGTYTYERFVDHVEDVAFDSATVPPAGVADRVRHALWKAVEALSRLEIGAGVRVGPLLRRLRGRLANS